MFYIYGKYNSKSCDKAEFLLYTIGYEYRLFIYGVDYTINQFQKFFPEIDTVPQVYHDMKYIGGLRELYEYLLANKNIIDGSASKLSILEKPIDIDMEDE